jgi:hypothetical protein
MERADKSVAESKDSAVIAAAGVGGDFPDRIAAAEAETRPRYALEGHEDEMYHELRLGTRAAEPDYCAFLGQYWTFNRAMRWTEAPNGALLCRETGGALVLTGESRVSDWFSGPANKIEHQGRELRFTKGAVRRREVVTLPALQMNLERYPELELTVSETTVQWQVCALVKGRGGPPLLAGGWRRGPGTERLNLLNAWREKGFTLRFGEFHIAVGLWTDDPESAAVLTFTAQMPGRAAVVPCMPVIRRAGAAAPVAAFVLDPEGNPLRPDGLTVTASAAGRTTVLRADADGLWTGELAGLPEGDHTAEIRAGGESSLSSALQIRMTGGAFYSYDTRLKSVTLDGKALGPLSGATQQMLLFRDAGEPGEELMQGQDAWDTRPGETGHYWEALTEAELDKRFAYLESCGWDLLHLVTGWGFWEKLDAGGHLAPHGAEQLSLLLRAAARHGLALAHAFTHYPYGTESGAGHVTLVLRQYLEAGFRDGDWKDPSAPFTKIFHQYLRECALMFRDETALLARSLSGEGDVAAGPARVNDTLHFVTGLDPAHIFLSEPINRLTKLPEAQCAGWEPVLRGDRMYWAGEAQEPDIDLGVEFKMMQTGHYFMGEGSWFCPPRYVRFMAHDPRYAGRESWAGTDRYRRRVRDSLYLGLIHRNPILLTWDEQCAEDERIIFREARSLVDWSRPFLDATVAIRVGDENAGGWDADKLEGRLNLGRYESFFSALPLMTRYLAPEEPAPPGVPVFDARAPYVKPDLPDAVLDAAPLRLLSPGYRAAYCWSADRRTLLAYLCNVTQHTDIGGRHDLSGKWQRLPKPAELRLQVRNLPSETLHSRLYSLSSRTCAERRVKESALFEPGISAEDYLLVITPQ